MQLTLCRHNHDWDGLHGTYVCHLISTTYFLQQCSDIDVAHLCALGQVKEGSHRFDDCVDGTSNLTSFAIYRALVLEFECARSGFQLACGPLFGLRRLLTVSQSPFSFYML